MKKIFIPTDFSVESLQLIDYAILNYQDPKLNIVLIAGFKLPESRMDVMTFSPGKVVLKLTDSAFLKAKNNYLEEHSDRINCISIELFTGLNSFAFKNFAQTLQITNAIVPKDDFLAFSNKKTFNPIPFIRKNIQHVADVEVVKEESKVKVSNLIPKFLKQFS